MYVICVCTIYNCTLCLIRLAPVLFMHDFQSSEKYCLPLGYKLVQMYTFKNSYGLSSSKKTLTDLRNIHTVCVFSPDFSEMLAYVCINNCFCVVEYPKRVWLTDETGVPLESVVGRIGDIVSLICNVPCSNPEPRVQWKDGDGSSLGDGSLSPEGECNYTSVINVPLTHALAGNTITCSAQNIEMWPAVSAKSEVVLTPCKSVAGPMNGVR